MGAKLVIIGGGSTYTPEVIDGLIQRRDEIPLRELALVDIYQERLAVMHGMVSRMLHHAGYPLTLSATTHRERALDGADFVIAQLRVGGMAARLIDETVPPRFGVIGQETIGPGGLLKAMRTIPIMLGIAEDIERYCPSAWLLNFTNPSGMVTEALLHETKVKTLGLCNIPMDMHSDAARLLDVSLERITLDYIGLNHLGWVRDVHLDGVSVMERVLQATIHAARQEKDPLFSPDLLHTLGLLPGYYLSYYYNRDRMLTEQVQSTQSRTERVMEIESELFRLYADPLTVERPALLNQRGGRHYSTAAMRIIHALWHDTGAVNVVNVLNQGTFSSLPPDAVIETACRVDAEGAHPLPAAPIPTIIRGLMESVKASEALAVQAAVAGNLGIALQSLLAHPLVPSFAVARSLLAALVAEHADYLPQFAPRKLTQ
ncbi:MAG TPA: 6-phospho-beta-glucosidase [Aggregatilineales bacterium]|nr:6-phospho-beta-glucosidase [Anaerolineales bacterium]HRE46531.1 6-phospho-beta-glucosidase [Aggregatilineales bacterium]